MKNEGDENLVLQNARTGLSSSLRLHVHAQPHKPESMIRIKMSRSKDVDVRPSVYSS